MCCGVEPNEPKKKKGDKDAAREERLYTYPLLLLRRFRSASLEHNTTEQRATRALMAMGAALRAAAADAVVTFLWVMCVSTLGASTAAVTSYLRLQGVHYALLVTVSLLSVLLFAFNILGDALGGASFNPTGVAAFYAAGVTSPSLFSVALRLPAQVSFHLNLGSVQFKGSEMSSERLMRTTN